MRYIQFQLYNIGLDCWFVLDLWVNIVNLDCVVCVWYDFGKWNWLYKILNHRQHVSSFVYAIQIIAFVFFFSFHVSCNLLIKKEKQKSKNQISETQTFRYSTHTHMATDKNDFFTHLAISNSIRVFVCFISLWSLSIWIISRPQLTCHSLQLNRCYLRIFICKLTKLNNEHIN